MKFSDFSPPSAPSVTEQQDALQKGLGRAVQWALARRLAEEMLLEACLYDRCFDVQVEDTRGEWLWGMIQALGAIDKFRVPILQALCDLPEERDAHQLCQLTYHYAKNGDSAFRERLYDIVAQRPFANSPTLGEEDILRLDGAEAFLFVARVRGNALAHRSWEWHDDTFVDYAQQQLGEANVMQLLESSGDEPLQKFRDAWYNATMIKAGRRSPSHRERMRAITVSEIISSAEESGAHRGTFRGWGRHAEHGQLETVLQHLWSTSEAKVIANLLSVFSNRALPRFDDRLIELCGHSDAEVKRRAFIALEKNKHARVREFVIHELQKGSTERHLVGLFINNYRKGDERIILESFALPHDVSELHWLLMDILEVLETNPETDGSQLGLIVYASTPCANCRTRSARLLRQRHVAPEWLLGECRYDVSPECRGISTGGQELTASRS